MKILSLDPGAKRCGWAILSWDDKDQAEIKYHHSGILGVERASNPHEPYQAYRLRLIGYWQVQMLDLFEAHLPTTLVSEIVPVVGGGNFVAATQSQLAGVVQTTAEVVASYHGYAIAHIAASTVKKKIGGDGRASKAKVRDGVLAWLPELSARRPEWTGKTAVWDEVDALAIGLAYLSQEYIDKPKRAPKGARSSTSRVTGDLPALSGVSRASDVADANQQ